jgi:hypothetical protein
MGEGTKGPRLFDWACVPILHKWEDDGCHWLLIRRRIDNPKKKTYYVVFGPHDTTLQKMVTVIGYRWRIEDDFKTSKGMGLDQYEVRRWSCWYRHITLVMIAHALLAVICVESKKTIVVDASPPNTPSPIAVIDIYPTSPSNSHISPTIPATALSLVRHSDVSSPVTVLDSPPPPLPHVFHAVSPSLAALPRPALAEPLLSSVLPVPKPLSSPPVFSLAPLTIPEVRHLLGHLIWPPSTNATFVLAWSTWRRYHRGMSSYYHTKRRLDAG